jgi:hypothetical protein
MRLRKWIAIVVMLFVLSGLCLGTAIDFRPEKYDEATGRSIKATIAKSDVPKGASREQIIHRLLSIWLDGHRIGTFGWMYWLWDYKIGRIDATNPVCITTDVKVWPFLPDEFTFWADPNTGSYKYGDWYPEAEFVTLDENEYYYYITTFSFC